jgi:hypothetical protein
MMTLVPGLAEAEKSQVDRRLGAGGHADLLALVPHAEVALERAGDCVAELRQAGGRGVLGVPGLDRGDAALAGDFGGAEVRFAGREGDHVLAAGAELGGAGGDGEGRGFGDQLEGAGDFHGGGPQDECGLGSRRGAESRRLAAGSASVRRRKGGTSQVLEPGWAKAGGRSLGGVSKVGAFRTSKSRPAPATFAPR